MLGLGFWFARRQQVQKKETKKRISKIDSQSCSSAPERMIANLQDWQQRSYTHFLSLFLVIFHGVPVQFCDLNFKYRQSLPVSIV
jgi:hypothetical protein